MPEKRFTEDEARRIFARVAERQVRAHEGEPGLTLSEMQEAARASGLDPALVAAVAAEMVGGAPEAGEVPAFLGAPLAVRQTRVVPVEVGDEGWARVVAELRRAFGSPGVPTDLGRVREWTSTTTTGGTPIHVSLMPGEGTTTVTIEQSIAKQARGAEWIFPGAVLSMAGLAGLVQLIGAAGPEIWALPVFVASIVAVVLGGVWFMWRGWARRTERRFERAMDRVELAARDAAPPPASAELRAHPRLSLGDLPESAHDLPEADEVAASRTGTRARS